MTDREKWLELSEKNGIAKNTFLSRVQRGMDPQEAATLPPNSFRRERTWSMPGFEQTNEQVKTAKKNGITEVCMSTRLNYGWSVEEAMLVPPGGKREDFQKIKAKKRDLIEHRWQKTERILQLLPQKLESPTGRRSAIWKAE